MEHIPDDATHWHGGDWIEYHRTSLGLDERPGTAATRDPLARMTAMHVSMLRAAKSYYEITGHHLPIYCMIAHVHAAIFYDLPLEGPERCCAGTGIEILHLPPHGPDNIVQVDLSQPFHTLIMAYPRQLHHPGADDPPQRVAPRPRERALRPEMAGNAARGLTRYRRVLQHPALWPKPSPTARAF